MLGGGAEANVVDHEISEVLNYRQRAGEMDGVKTTQFAWGKNCSPLDDYVINGEEVDSVQESPNVINQRSIDSLTRTK